MSSGSQDSKTVLATTHNAEIDGSGLHCAFQSQAFDGLRAVSSTRPADIQQCAVFDGAQDNARLIGTEFVVSEKIFRMLPEDETVLWHSHNVEVEHGSLSSPGTHEVSDTYGRVIRSLENNSKNVLPPALTQLLTTFSDPGTEKRHVSFLEDEAAEPDEETVEIATDNTPHHLENIKDKEDEYLNDAVHRPVVHHKSSHLPALTGRLPDDGQFLSETRSTGF